ncbi:hypothetical protein ACT1U9_32320 [Streptomyces sp. BR1]|uniref:hypothetical protein n=1 Tax=Streptomyces sp. BR1 TaxID=1592323 RepID=UPI00402BF086
MADPRERSGRTGTRGKADRLAGRAAACFVIGGLVLGALLIPGVGNSPKGWGPAYAVGTPVAVELSGACDIRSVRTSSKAGRSVARCADAEWTQDGTVRTGTLYAYGSDISGNREGRPSFTGEARAFRGRAYGRPTGLDLVMSFAVVSVLVLCLLGCIGFAAAAYRARRSV